MNQKTSPALPELPDWIPWAGRPWIIAFSGGADSATLLDLAARNRSLASGIEAVYVHHHLQSIADDWEVFCRERCRELDIPFSAEHVTVDTSRGSVEAAAREARYQALSRHMLALNNPVLFVAHHQDDLLESVLLALFRGSSLRGLTSLKPEKPFCNGTLARPLLSLTRRDIEEYTREHGISCSCGSERYTMEVRPTYVDLICADCGARLRIDAATDDDLDRLCCHWTLQIKGN